jgi:hypothetical protein
MDQIPADDAADTTGFSRLEIVVNTLTGGDSNSPLACAIRRRHRELEHPTPVTAGHDSVI